VGWGFWWVGGFWCCLGVVFVVFVRPMGEKRGGPGRKSCLVSHHNGQRKNCKTMMRGGENTDKPRRGDGKASADGKGSCRR